MPGNARCEVCHKKYPSLRLLSAHQAGSECPATLSDVFCDICSLQMPHNIDLKKHQQQCRGQLLRRQRDGTLDPMENRSHGGVKKRRRTPPGRAKALRLIHSHRRLVASTRIGLNLLHTQPQAAFAVINMALTEASAVLADVADEFPEAKPQVQPQPGTPMLGVHRPVMQPMPAPGLQHPWGAVSMAPAGQPRLPGPYPVPVHDVNALAAAAAAAGYAPNPFYMNPMANQQLAAAQAAAAAGMRPAVPLAATMAPATMAVAAATTTAAAPAVPVPVLMPMHAQPRIAGSQPMHNAIASTLDGSKPVMASRAYVEGVHEATRAASLPLLAEDQEVPPSPAVAEDMTPPHNSVPA